jgi:hypothetical protein
MKYILTLAIMFMFTGCWWDKDPIVPEIRYITKECPTPKPKPVFVKYEAVILEINGEEYYAFPKSEAIKLSTNWVSYRSWAEANYNLIKKEDIK